MLVVSFSIIIRFMSSRSVPGASERCKALYKAVEVFQSSGITSIVFLRMALAVSLGWHTFNVLLISIGGNASVLNWRWTVEMRDEEFTT